MIRFCCKGCGRQYKVPDNYAGKKVRCKICNSPNIISTQEIEHEDNVLSDLEVSEGNIYPNRTPGNSHVIGRKKNSKSN